MILRSISSAISIQSSQDQRRIVAVATEAIDQRILALDIFCRLGKRLWQANRLPHLSSHQSQSGGKCAERARGPERLSEGSFRRAERDLIEPLAEYVLQRVRFHLVAGPAAGRAGDDAADRI